MIDSILPNWIRPDSPHVKALLASDRLSTWDSKHFPERTHGQLIRVIGGPGEPGSSYFHFSEEKLVTCKFIMVFNEIV